MKNYDNESKERKNQTAPFIFIIIFYAITIIHNLVSFIILKSTSSNIGFYGGCILVLVIILKYIIYLVAFISAIICFFNRKGKNKKYAFITILLLVIWVPIAILGIAPFSQTTKLLTNNNSTKNSTSQNPNNKVPTTEANAMKQSNPLTYDQQYENKIKQSKIELAPNKLIKVAFGATLDDIKKVEGDNEIEPMYGLYKEKDSDEWVTGSQVASYSVNTKAGNWDMNEDYQVDGNGKVNSISLVYNKDTNPTQGLYKKYLDLKQQFSEIYGEPLYLSRGEKLFSNDAPKNNDENTFDEQIGNGYLRLESNFSAKDTRIKLFVLGCKNNNPALGPQNVGSVQVLIMPFEEKK